MERLSMCRICLVEDLHLRVIVDTHLQEMYESLTLMPLEADDSRPVLLCYICCARLQNCYQLRKCCLWSEELLAQMLNSDVASRNLVKSSETKRLDIKHPVVHLSIDRTPTMNQDTDHFIEMFNEKTKQEIKDMKRESSESTAIAEFSDTTEHGSLEFIKTEMLENDAVENDMESEGLIYDKLEIDMKDPDTAPPVTINPSEAFCSSGVSADASVEIVKTENAEDIETEPEAKEIIIPKEFEEKIEHSSSNLPMTQKNEVKTKRPKRNTKKVMYEEKPEPKSKSKKNLNKVTNDLLKNSMMYLNKQINNESGLTVNKVTMKTPVVPKQFSCDTCLKSFNTRAHLRKHFRTHTGEKPFECAVCKKRFSVKINLKYHMRTHTGEKPFECPHCDKRFSLKNNLEAHVRTHTGEKPHECLVCRKSYNQKDILNRHMRTHTGEQPYQCEMCERRFANRSAWRRHLRTHTGEKPHQCDVCLKTFTAKTTLDNHMRTHTGEKPHVCPICQKTFSVKSSLNNHFRVHSGLKPFKCEICNKGFSDKCTLKTHQRVHTGEKPFECNICKKKFGDVYYFRKHELRHQEKNSMSSF